MENYEEVTSRLTDQLGEPVDGKAFRTAIELGFIDAYLAEEIESQELENRYLRILDQEDLRQRGIRERRQAREAAVESGSDYRPTALALVFAFEAANDETVGSFRDEILDNSLLEWEDVEQWVVDHSVHDGPPTEWVTLPIDPQGTVPLTPAGTPPDEGDCVVDGHVMHYANRSTQLLVFPGRNNRVQSCPVRAGGVLDWLRITSEHLSSRYGWKEADATGFVLSGTHPPLPSVSWETLSPWPWWSARRSINLRIAYWATPQDVAGIYRELRNQLLDGDPKPRALSQPRAALGVFAFQHRSGHTWDEVMALWNQRNLGAQYEDVRVFTRDARQAFKRITGESLHWDVELSEPRTA